MSKGCGIYCMWRNKYKSNLGASLYFMLDRSRNGPHANQTLEAQPQMSRFLLTLVGDFVTHALKEGAGEGWGVRLKLRLRVERSDGVGGLLPP